MRPLFSITDSINTYIKATSSATKSEIFNSLDDDFWETNKIASVNFFKAGFCNKETFEERLPLNCNNLFWLKFPERTFNNSSFDCIKISLISGILTKCSECSDSFKPLTTSFQ